MTLTDTNKKIPHHYFGGTGPIIHFAHANGFPPTTYKKFLGHFINEHEVLAVNHRPLWQPAPTQNVDWNTVADDLIKFLEQQNNGKVIGLGHSLGAVATMLAAAKRPELFHKLVLIEPVFLMPFFMFTYKFLPQKWRQKVNPMVKAALNRRDHWDTKQDVYNSWRKKRVFAGFSDEVLTDLVEAAIKQDAGGFTLAYSKQWEAHFYNLVPTDVWSEIQKVKLPVMAIRGQNSNTLIPKAWAKWKKLQPHATFMEVEQTGHLVPMEKPRFLAKEIRKFLAG